MYRRPCSLFARMILQRLPDLRNSQACSQLKTWKKYHHLFIKTKTQKYRRRGCWVIKAKRKWKWLKDVRTSLEVWFHPGNSKTERAPCSVPFCYRMILLATSRTVCTYASEKCPAGLEVSNHWTSAIPCGCDVTINHQVHFKYLPY